MVKCEANCIYSDKGVCRSEVINIEGFNVNSKLGTFCSNFKSKATTCLEKLKTNKEVLCNANRCKHNCKNHCNNKIVNIAGDNLTSFKYETQCNNFVLDFDKMNDTL